MSGQNTFTIGLADGGQDYADARVAINGAYRPMITTLGKPRAMPA